MPEAAAKKDAWQKLPIWTIAVKTFGN